LHKNCAICTKRLDKLRSKYYRRVTNENQIIKLNSAKYTIMLNKNKTPNNIAISSGDFVCNSCITLSHRYSQESTKKVKTTHITQESEIPSPSTSHPSYSETNINESNTISVSIPRTRISSNNCVICKVSKNIIAVPNDAYTDVFIQSNILIPRESKCCKSHLTADNTFKKSDINKLEIVSDETNLNGSEVMQLLDNLRHASKSTLFEKFSKPKHINDVECKRYTGLNKDDFKSLLSNLVSLKNSTSRNRAQALAVYMFWLKTGLDFNTISTLFSLSNFQTVGEYCSQVRKSLINDFVPKNLGASHLPRNDWIKQNTLISKELFNVENNLILVADGTYCYCQKSSNNMFQRKAYSMQKSRPLVKPFVVCSTNGRIVDIYGLFPATDNDSTIIQKILETNKDLVKLIKPKDHILLDRGFRDSIQTLQNKYKLITHMPSCVHPRNKFLTTAEANQSRLVTKCRWIVENINGRLKTSFRANDKVHSNKTLCHTLEDFRISAALINKFYNRSESDKGHEMTIINEMKLKVNTINRLETIFESSRIDRKRSLYKRIDCNSIKDFPKLDLKTLTTKITLGTYQLRQSLGYLTEHISESGRYSIEIFSDNKSIFDENTRLLKTRIQSRHSNATKYNSYITYSPTTNSVANDSNSIKDWICSCKNGRRTVGCCSHVASVIYYLSHGRYVQSNKLNSTIGSIFQSHVVAESSDDSTDTSNDTEVSDIETETTEVESITSSIYPDLSQMMDD
jgi:hypothetical protein